jgi:hypothetical protein
MYVQIWCEVQIRTPSTKLAQVQIYKFALNFAPGAG